MDTLLAIGLVMLALWTVKRIISASTKPKIRPMTLRETLREMDDNNR